MNVLVAPDKLKGSLSAREAATALVRGILEAEPSATVDVCPLSDGGEGFLDVFTEGQGAAFRRTRVTGPLGDPVEASWALLPDGTAVLESARAVGLALVPEHRRDPSQTTSYGLGELMRAALDAGARRIVIGVGGSATNDGGAGLAAALGVTFEPSGPRPVGARLSGLSAVDRRAIDPRLEAVELVIAHDVHSPLTGPRGAALVFAPQKGASTRQAQELDRALVHFASLLGDPGVHPGDGAAGGIGYALRVLCGAKTASGIDLVLDLLNVDARLSGCDLVLTSEGRIDAQSAEGKVIGGLCRRAAAQRVPVVAIVGARDRDLEGLYDQGLSACFSLTDGPLTETEAMRRAAELLSATAREVTRLARARP